MKRFAFITLLIIVGGLGVLLISLKTLQPQVCGVKEFEPFCGTINLSENASKGKQIFNINCAACHKLNKDMTGPALSKKAKFYDSISFSSFIKQNTRVHPIDSLYNSNCMKFPNLSNEDGYRLFEYISK